MRSSHVPKVMIFRPEVGGECLWDERGNCIDYRQDLSLPAELVDRLNDWNEYGWRVYESRVVPHLAPGEPHGPTDFDEDWFVAEGEALAGELRRALGRNVDLRVEL